MVFEGSAVAISHTGKVRSNNQDSGYSGSNLFVVADGMGGHAGGDVASALAIQRLQGLDRVYETTHEAERAIRSAVREAAGDLITMTGQRPELTGMGTTIDALIMVDDYAVIGHIGDSRVYLYRDGELTQVTTDHTFVQRLVDSGRITLEEARYHPRRSVLMRVLGDQDPSPEIDTFVMQAQDGDRWILCSDGLSGVVDEAHITKVLQHNQAPGRTADLLLKQALDGGAPDNVTIVVVDVGGQHPTYSSTATVVGSAANPIGKQLPDVRPTSRSGWLHPLRQAANEPSHFEPAEEYFEELIEEDRRRARRRRITWIIGILLVLAGFVGLGYLGYSWTQTRYYVGADEDSVVIYQGVQQGIGPISLSHPHTDTGIMLEDLGDFDRSKVEETVSADSLEDAQQIVERLRDHAGDKR